MAQKVVIVWQGVGLIATDNTEEINGLINEGWSVVSVTPMYGAGPIGTAGENISLAQVRFAAVVVLQQ